MGKVAAWWHRIGYSLFPSHQKELDNINKVTVDLRGDLSNARSELAAALVAADSLRNRLKAAEDAFPRVQTVVKVHTAAELRRLMEQDGAKEGEGDGV